MSHADIARSAMNHGLTSQGRATMAAPRIVVMGVCGCGKTTVGEALAAELRLPYVEGDLLHSPQSVARMAAGVPLTDTDRQGWLREIGQQLAQARNGVVVTCSALKRSYRDVLRRAAPDLRLVYLRGAPSLLAARLAARQGHYMPAALLQSQLDILEPPAPDEHAIEVEVWGSPAQVLAEVRHQLQGPSA
jgi:carbohydrate kinase (thermoresistant glucokinase family)